MSKTQLQTNNAKLEALITELQGKAAGGGGGASLETCAVIVKGCKAVYYTGVENGATVAKASTGANATATHNIIVCKNSMVVCALLQGTSIIVTGGELNASYLTYYCACEVTSDNASITATNQGGSID